MKLFFMLIVVSTIFVDVTVTEQVPSDLANNVETGRFKRSTVQCDAQADVLFVMDASGSIGEDNFKYMLEFVVNITRSFNIGPNDIQFGTIVFSSTAQRVFNLNNYTDHAGLEKAIMDTPYDAGSTYTDDALALAANEGLTPQYGARNDTPRIVLVFTDGKSQTSHDTAVQAQVLRDAGVKVLSIGIGSGIGQTELENIATTPSDVFQVTGFDALNSIIRELTNRTCRLGKRPILNGPNIAGNTFNFTCEIDVEQGDPNQVVEVTWVFNKTEDNNIAPQKLTALPWVATLDGSKLAGHMSTDLQCKVRAYISGNEQGASFYVYSRPYFLGIQAYPARLEVSEEESFKQVTINSTLPFLCEDNSDECCITIKLDTDAHNQNDVSDVSVGSACNYKLCQENSTAQFPVVKVPVVARQDMIADGDKQLLLTFEPLTPPNNLGPYMDIFSKHIPQQVQVTVKDQDTYRCGMTGGAHIASFDQGNYHLDDVGEFIAYDVPEEIFQVQIKTWRGWENGTTSICGVAFREKNDIIRINMCDQLYNDSTTSPVVDAVYELREGTIVQRSEDGRSIGVYLPSGVEIKINGREAYLNVFVTGPGTHENKAKGICGTNDGNKDNEFTRRNGTVDPICSDGDDQNCRPDDFFYSWSVLAEDSFFTTIPDRVEVEEEEVEYCTCDKDKHNVTCGPRVNKEGTHTACPKCQDTKPVNRSEVTGNSDNQDGSYADVDYQPTSQQEVDPLKGWTTNIEVTPDQASEWCEAALQKSQLSSACSSHVEMSRAHMMNCISDVLRSGSTGFLEATTSALTADCQLTLAEDPANYVSNPDGQLVMKAEYLEDICDLACDEHGVCGQGGVCQCDEGWEGENCQIQSGKGPQLLKVRSGQLCDVVERPCQKIFMDVSNIKLSDELVCRLQPVDASGAEIGDPVETGAEFVSAYRISCGRSKTSTSSQRYMVSASNDGGLFGNALPLHVFDSTCLDCTEEGCREKLTACHIDDVCYTNGAQHPDDANKVCDVSKTHSAWTLLKAGKNAATTVGPCMWKLLIPFMGFLSIRSYF